MSHASDEDIRQMNEIVERARAVDEYGHGLCPWCGGKARLEGAVDEHGLLYLHPSCMVCGFEGQTSMPALCTPQEWFRMAPERANERVERAWLPWDQAWWRGGPSCLALPRGRSLAPSDSSASGQRDGQP